MAFKANFADMFVLSVAVVLLGCVAGGCGAAAAAGMCSCGAATNVQMFVLSVTLGPCRRGHGNDI